MGVMRGAEDVRRSLKGIEEVEPCVESIGAIVPAMAERGIRAEALKPKHQQKVIRLRSQS
jgi:hypothetical protein